MSTELVKASAKDVAANLLKDMEQEINAAAVEKERREHAARVEKAIKDHYFELAKKTLIPIWTRCGALTRHDEAKRKHYSSDHNGKTSETCGVCGGSLFKGKLQKDGSRAHDAIFTLAGQLRSADRDAGVEFIPRFA